MCIHHVDPSAQQLIWNSYEEFKLIYESIIIEDPKEETTAKLKTYTEKVDKVFQKLKASMSYGCLMEYDRIEGEVTSCNLSDKPCMVNLVYNLQKTENNSNYSALKISYHLGFLFIKLKKLYKSVRRLITALKLDVSQQYVQDKICLYKLLNLYPCLQTM